jgi:hypothetical protein
MLYFRRSPFLRRVVLPITLLAFLSACHKWVPLEPPVAQAVAERDPGTIRVTLADGSQVVLKEPRISGDSLMALEDVKEPHPAAVRASKAPDVNRALGGKVPPLSPLKSANWAI